MLLSEVGYARPATLEQALEVLTEHPGARALAGGQTLINVMKARAAAPDVLVDLSKIGKLKGIELGSDGTLAIGPMTTYSELIASAEAWTSEGGSRSASRTAFRTASGSDDVASSATGVAATQPSATRTPPLSDAAAFTMQVPSVPIGTEAKPSLRPAGTVIPVSSSPGPAAVM